MMETLVEPVPTSPSLKRPLPQDVEVTTPQNPAINLSVQPPTSPDSGGSSQHPNHRPLLPNGSSRQQSPALSSVSSLSNLSSRLSPMGLDGTAQSTERQAASSGSTGQPHPPKRRKLTPLEKQQRQEEKERKQREKAEQRAKRDEEKQAKDEERRQKNEEKEARRRDKELEKLRIEEEKEKKERAQPRMTAFFAKPTSSARQACEPASQNSGQHDSPKKIPDNKLLAPTKSDYERTFFPFSLPSNSTWASRSVFSWDDSAVEHIKSIIDRDLVSGDQPVTLPQSLDAQPPDLTTRGVRHKVVKDIIRALSLSDSQSDCNPLQGLRSPLQELRSVPMKYIFFSEDIRPPYVGTYTKLSQKQLHHAARNPFARVRSDTNYNYDSEAEWEEPEEGEDLLSEGESELESADEGEEMADFLDDEDSEGQVGKRKIISGDLEPICSGLCYEDSKGLLLDSKGQKSEICQYKMELLHNLMRLPIDPFSSSYWAVAPGGVKKAEAAESAVEMQPPRQPLVARPNFFENVPRTKNPPSGEKATKLKRGPTASNGRTLEGQELEDLKEAVSGSEHTKIGLLAILKKQFPKIPKDVLKTTLETVAERKGSSEAEKRWKLKEGK